MKNCLVYLKAHAYFLVSYTVLLLLAGVLQIIYRQPTIISWVNQRYSVMADWFFQYATFLGDGRFCVSIGLLFLGWSYRKSILILSTFVVSGLLSQLLKNSFDEPRPAAYFHETIAYFHTIQGVEFLQSHSFPSGHTTSAFALFALLAIWTKNQYLKPLWLVPAVAVAYSRMYLFQHFLIDVFFGSILGTITAFVFNCFLENYWVKKPKKWHLNGLLNISNKANPFS
jgi:membrane-associated phospholipid phosphatase